MGRFDATRLKRSRPIHRDNSSWAWADVGLLALLGNLPDDAHVAYNRLGEINPSRWELESMIAALNAVRHSLAGSHVGVENVPGLPATTDGLRAARGSLETEPR